ncbi:MAG: MerR family transcriptional regulator [Pseudarcicella sp.]|nr:MerR family transcriptional regulator [Pseudarcicella sp.]MBP6409534.1 MerR family transcriptional regulator [Pseudarcicella sp.]
MELKKNYYTISEVADLYGINISKLRFWEENFPSLKPDRDRAGDRKYNKEEVLHVGLIKKLLEVEKYTLEGANQAIKRKNNKKNENAVVLKKLHNLKEFLEFLKKDLQETERSQELDLSENL